MSMNETSRQRQLQLLGALSAAVALTCPVAALANPANCSTWSSTAVYTAGAVVVDKGKTYKANWWTQGNEPVTNNGGSGTGKPWTLSSGCSSTPTPPAPTPPSPTPKPPAPPAPTPPAPSPSSGLNGDVSPGHNFNLAPFQLQLPTGPTGHPDTVSGSELKSYTDSPYFYTNKSDGAMVMADPKEGTTTIGSKHPRVELRENAIWKTSGTNILRGTVEVAEVPDHTTVAQIFQGTGPSKPLCELQVKASGLVQLLLESTNTGGVSTTPHITTVTIGKKFDYELKLSGTTIFVTVNGVSTTFPMPSEFIGESFYFKAGDYDQSATAGTPSATASTVVKYYALSITH